MLAEKYPLEKLREILVEEWHPYPTAEEREAWDGLPDPIRKAYIDRGGGAHAFDWPALTATAFLDHFRTSNRSRFQN
jgi:hypothetical protein